MNGSDFDNLPLSPVIGLMVIFAIIVISLWELGKFFMQHIAIIWR